MDFYVGGTGKDYSWCLVSDCPFVVYDKKKNEFIAVKTIEEVAPYYESDAVYEVYALDSGRWNEVHFLALNQKPLKAIGFRPEEKSN